MVKTRLHLLRVLAGLGPEFLGAALLSVLILFNRRKADEGLIWNVKGPLRNFPCRRKGMSQAAYGGKSIVSQDP